MKGGVWGRGGKSLAPVAHGFSQRVLAGRLAAEGMEIAALTPGQFAHWLAAVMNRA
jgi:hypothetical protein